MYVCSQPASFSIFRGCPFFRGGVYSPCITSTAAKGNGLLNLLPGWRPGQPDVLGYLLLLVLRSFVSASASAVWGLEESEREERTESRIGTCLQFGKLGDDVGWTARYIVPDSVYMIDV